MLTVLVGGAKPDSSDRLDPPGEGAVVDDFVADLSTPPIRSIVSRRISMQPPAAAAVRRAGSATRRGG